MDNSNSNSVFPLVLDGSAVTEGIHEEEASVDDCDDQSEDQEDKAEGEEDDDEDADEDLGVSGQHDVSSLLKMMILCAQYAVAHHVNGKNLEKKLWKAWRGCMNTGKMDPCSMQMVNLCQWLICALSVIQCLLGQNMEC